MITNERQYRITRAELKRFEEALAAQSSAGPRTGVHPRIHQAMLDGMASQRDELREQLERYDDLRSGRVAQRSLTSLRELPIALIEARIAARLTQRELAKRLGVPEQQVQRWEANSYSGAGIERGLKIFGDQREQGRHNRPPRVHARRGRPGPDGEQARR